jgi:hypothetical protein
MLLATHAYWKPNSILSMIRLLPLIIYFFSCEGAKLCMEVDHHSIRLCGSDQETFGS